MREPRLAEAIWAPSEPRPVLSPGEAIDRSACGSFTGAAAISYVALAALVACGTDRAPGAPPPSTRAAVDAASAAAARGDALIPFEDAESAARLARAASPDFFSLANHFEGQQHGGMCGPTTAVIVLNALREDAPPDTKPVDRATIPAEYAAAIPPQYDPFLRRYTQATFFDDPRVTAVKTEAAFYGAPATPGARPDPGLQLRQLHDMLRALGLDSTIRVVDDAVPDDVARRELADNLARGGDYVIVNYDRKVLDQPGGGHISPLGAYDAATDSFLVLDVNPNQGKTWVWVPAARMIAAMRTRDRDEHRGYLLVREGAGPAAPAPTP